MKALVMFVAPVVAAFATATVPQKQNKKSSLRIVHAKSGKAPVGDAYFTIDAPVAPLSFWELGICRPSTLHLP